MVTKGSLRRSARIAAMNKDKAMAKEHTVNNTEMKNTTKRANVRGLKSSANREPTDNESKKSSSPKNTKREAPAKQVQDWQSMDAIELRRSAQELLRRPNKGTTSARIQADAQGHGSDSNPQSGNTAADTNAINGAASRTQSTRCRPKSRKCSLQSLENEYASSRCQRPTRHARRVTASPVLKHRRTSVGKGAKCPKDATNVSKRLMHSDYVADKKGVQFNLGRNSFAQYNKENPPNVVQYLNDEVEYDEETRTNEAILAEWEDNFADLDN